MEAVATVEQRPAYLSISGMHNELVGATHKYQGGIEFIAAFFVKVPVIFVHLFSGFFIGARSEFLVRLCESCFHRGRQAIARSIYNVRP